MAISKTITIGNKTNHPLVVNRLGYGTMRLTGEEIYGEPLNRPEALQILKYAIKSGINFLDTADYYGEDVTNRLIAEALHPYTDDLVICTKIGGARKPDKSWIPHNKPEQLRLSIDRNLSTLKKDQIQLVHFRKMGGDMDSFKLSMDTMFQLQKEGKIIHVGVSNVNEAELAVALSMGDIASVENMYGHVQRSTLKLPHAEFKGGTGVLEMCEKNEIPFIPYYSLFVSIPKKDERIAEIARKYNTTEAQINIAWLLHRSPWILPIPGTSSLLHFEENIKAAEIDLTEADINFLN